MLGCQGSTHSTCNHQAWVTCMQLLSKSSRHIAAVCSSVASACGFAPAAFAGHGLGHQTALYGAKHNLTKACKHRDGRQGRARSVVLLPRISNTSSHFASCMLVQHTSQCTSDTHVVLQRPPSFLP